MVVRVRKPGLDEVSQLRKGAIQISYLDPYNETELVDRLASQDVTTISMSNLVA